MQEKFRSKQVKLCRQAGAELDTIHKTKVCYRDKNSDQMGMDGVTAEASYFLFLTLEQCDLSHSNR